MIALAVTPVRPPASHQHLVSLSSLPSRSFKLPFNECAPLRSSLPLKHIVSFIVLPFAIESSFPVCPWLSVIIRMRISWERQGLRCCTLPTFTRSSGRWSIPCNSRLHLYGYLVGFLGLFHCVFFSNVPLSPRGLLNWGQAIKRVHKRFEDLISACQVLLR